MKSELIDVLIRCKPTDQQEYRMILRDVEQTISALSNEQRFPCLHFYHFHGEGGGGEGLKSKKNQKTQQPVSREMNLSFVNLS